MAAICEPISNGADDGSSPGPIAELNVLEELDTEDWDDDAVFISTSLLERTSPEEIPSALMFADDDTVVNS